MKAWTRCAIMVLTCAITLPSGVMANTATIEKVLAGDRLQIKGWQVVRLTGIICPKLDENCGREAHQFAKQELEGKLVVMRTYTTDNTAAGIVQDEEGLCMVQIEYGWITGSKDEKAGDTSPPADFGALMIQKGLARIDEKYLPDWLHHYREIERIARENRIGIWADHSSK